MFNRWVTANKLPATVPENNNSFIALLPGMQRSAEIVPAR